MKLWMLVEGLKSDRQIGTSYDVGHLRVWEGIAGAGVTTGWAAISGFSFGGGIIYKITRGTSVLEGVIKPDPVTS